MTKPTRNLAIALLAGAAGYAAFFYLFPRADPLAAWPYRLDRQQAIALAHDASRRLGFDTTGWRGGVSTENDLKLQYWQRRNAREGPDFFPSPVETIVLLHEPNGKKEARLQFSQSGMLAGFTLRDRSATDPVPPAWVDTAFREVAGPYAPLFNKRPGGMAQPDWERARKDEDWQEFMKPAVETPWELTRGRRTLRIAVRSDPKRRSVQLSNRWTDDAPGSYRDRERVIQFTEALIAIPAILLAIVAIALFLQGALKRSISWRRTLVFIGFLAAATILRHFTGISGSGDSSFALLLPGLGGLIPIAAILAAGETVARIYERLRWESFYLALRGRFDSRAVGDSLAAGILFGGVLAALPFAVAMNPYLSDTEFKPAGLEVLGSSTPALHMLLPAPQPMLMGFFFFLTPMLGRLIPSARWRTPLWWIFGIGLMLGAKSAALGLPAALAAAALMWAVLCWTYLQHGLLAVLAASAFAGVAKEAGALLATGSTDLQSSGWRVLIGGAIVLGITLTVRARGRHVVIDDVALPADAMLTEREKLKSAFTEAHVAQQRMLPSEAPEIDGFTLAASCQPAREVGGDLYDYFRLADGRYGICVADVSGKGMGAALYMTLTKGALTAAAQSTGDLSDLARRLNTHIYAAARRRVFVTAALAAIDPVTGVVEHVRAGHNPIVLRRVNGETRFLQPPGMGLGIGPTRLFARSLENETVTLEPGDTLIFYSDGLTEAMNPRLEQYGEDRLCATLAGSDGLSGDALRRRILQDVEAFTDGEPSHDDLTLLVVSCTRAA